MTISLKIFCRIIRDRVVFGVGDEPPRVLARVVRCPCCGCPQLVEA